MPSAKPLERRLLSTIAVEKFGARSLGENMLGGSFCAPGARYHESASGTRVNLSAMSELNEKIYG